MVNEGVVVTDGIGAGFISPDAAFYMRGNLGIGQLSGINNRRLDFDDLQIIFTVIPTGVPIFRDGVEESAKISRFLGSLRSLGMTSGIIVGRKTSATFADKGEARDNLVGFAEEHSCNLFGVAGVAGFADDLALEINDGIRAYNNRIGILVCDVFCFGESKLSGIFDRSDIFSWENLFVDSRNNDGKFVAGVREELFTPWGGRCENQGLGINIQCPISNVQ